MTRHSTVIRIAGILLLSLVVMRTTADVDLWGHVLFGRDIVQTGHVAGPDPYSFTSDRAWMNHEWLAEVLMYFAFAAGGPAGLAVLRLSIILAVGALVLLVARLDGLSTKRTDILVALAVVLTMPRTQHVRPQLFSVLCFAALLYIFKRFERGDRRAIWFVPPLMMAWANLHGGWIVGVGVLGLWSAFELLRRASTVRTRALVASVAVCAVLATLLNPYGWHLWAFLGETVGFGRSDITEWGPITKALPGMLAMWVVTALLAAMAIFRSQPPYRWPHIVMALTLGVMSFRVQRLDAFFALAVVMLLQPAFSRARAAVATETARLRPWSVAAVCAVIAATGFAGPGPMTSAACIEMDRVDFLPEPEAVPFIRSHGLEGRMITFFDWGEYAIWHLTPGIKVSMDGRRETVYSSEQIQRHLRIYEGWATGADIAALDADLAWLPVRSPGVAQLKKAGWHPVFTGSRSVILSKTLIANVPEPAMAAAALDAAPSPGRCFPGP
jgi:hypothetical protein